jgi:putative ABC transport system permease protein
VLALIAANVGRRRARTFLTAAGIAVGVAAVVALLALSDGLNRTAGQLLHLGGADLGIFQRDASDLTTSVLPLSMEPRISAQPVVAEVTPVQLVVDAVPGAPGSVVLGVQRGGFFDRSLVLTQGTRASPGRVELGDVLARTLHLGPGDPIVLARHRFTIAGVYHAGTGYIDTGVIATLADAQMLASRTPEEVTTFGVRLAPRVSTQQGERALNRAIPGVIAISRPGQAARAGVNSELISKAVGLIVVLALIIGALAVANTMLAAILERRRELALLATIGWSGRQLGELVLGEAMAVSLLGTAFGLLLGLAASRLLPSALGLGEFISPQLTLSSLGLASLIGMLIGTVGALYPMWRVVRIRPVLALAQR